MNNTNNSIQEIYEICENLSKAGKTPTTALVKFRLKAPLPLPTIIKGVTNWKNTHKLINQTSSSEKASISNNTTQSLTNKNQEKQLTQEELLFKEMQDALSSEGGFTTISNISADEQNKATSHHTRTLEKTPNKTATISDEQFLHLPITEQLLYIKHLLENISK